MSADGTECGRQLSAALSADHAALEGVLQRLLAALREDRHDRVVALWRCVELDLGAHLRAEENLILPTFERAYPHHGAMIRRHHEQLRRTLEGMSVDVARGKLDAAGIEGLLDVLRRHARHEEVVFYYWAKLNLDEEDARRLLAQLRGASPGRDSKPSLRG